MLCLVVILLASVGLAADGAGTVNTSVLAQGIHPGAKVGVEFPLVDVESVKTRAGEDRTIGRQLVLEPALSFWVHRHNLTPITLSPQLLYRRVGHRGWTPELFVGQGVTYAINAGVTYEFDDQGELVGGALAGRWMSATQLGFGIGRDLSVTRDLDLAWHVRPAMTVWAPYNSGVAPVFSFELGVRRAWFSRGAP